MAQIKKIHILQVTLTDVVSLAPNTIDYIEYCVTCGSSYIGECKTLRELHVLLAGLTGDLLESEYCITFEM